MTGPLRWTLALVCNVIVVAVNAFLITKNIRKKNWKFFRYFTTLSNLFSALGCLAVIPWCVLRSFPPQAPVLVQYVSAVSVAVTFMTVMVFLGPTAGYGQMLGGSGLYVHLIGPLLCVVSCCLLEPVTWTAEEGMLGILPTAAYAAVYGVQVLVRKRWEDFYGFNRGGKWYVSVVAMLAGTALICLGMTALCIG